MESLPFTLIVVIVAVGADRVKFDEPRPFLLLPSIRNVTVGSRSMDSESTQYPLGVEAVLSVALKVQRVFQDHSSVQRNFLVSPIAIASALGQLMLGSRGEFRRQLGHLLTLRNTVQSRFAEAPTLCNSNVLDALEAQRTFNGTTSNTRTNSQEGKRIRIRNMFDYRTQSKIEMPSFASTTRKDGLPGLELHRQLGRLITTLSNSLQTPGVNGDNSSLVKSYLHMASAFFVNHDLEMNERFVRAIVDFYDSSIVPVNFSGNSAESQKLVNEWGSRQTGGLIKEFLKLPPRPDTAVLQLVAIHFRGAWETPFIRQGTVAGYFQTSKGTNVPVNLMRGTLEDVPYIESERLRLRMVAIPYIGSEYAMYVLLPSDDNPLKYEVGKIVSSLNETDIKELIDLTKYRTVNVIFPKLSLTSSLNLAKALGDYTSSSGHTDNHDRTVNGGATVSQPTSSEVDSSLPISDRKRVSNAIDERGTTNASSVGTVSSNRDDNAEPRTTSSSLGVVRPLVVYDARNSSGDGCAPADSSTIDNAKKGTPGTDKIVFSSRTGEVDDVNNVRPSLTNDQSSNGTKPFENAKSEIILTGAAPNGLFRVSDMIQEIALEINEAGTEAAAISGSTISYSGFVKNFKVDRPFIFFIRQEESKALLFWGIVVDPST